MSNIIKWRSPGPVATAFMKSNAFVRGIRGPFGSGKTVTCCMELMRRAQEQEPDQTGHRRTRWALIRNTNPQLKTTTIKTWQDWFGAEYGKFNLSPPYTHFVRFMHPKQDKTIVEAEVIFLALDKESDVKKLLSMELTGAFANEAREIPKSVIDGLTGRVGRFPAVKDGGATWSGIIMDTNAPHEEHWWPIMSGEKPAPEWMTEEERLTMIKPDDWEFFSQPAAMLEKYENKQLVGYELNPARENAKNLKRDYYEQIISGKARNWIKVYVLNQYQSLSDGKPVYPTFNSDVHVAKQPLQLVPGCELYVGIDFGRSPAAVMCQLLPTGRWLVLHELIESDMGANRFAPVLLRWLNRILGDIDYPIKFFGDPAGNALPQTDETTPMQILRNHGIPVREAPTNDIDIRTETVDRMLGEMINGEPKLLISPTCTVIKGGFEGSYQFAKVISRNFDDRYEERPLKNRYSHPHDALQYAFLGGGEARKLLHGNSKEARPVNVRQGRHYDAFGRRSVARSHKVRGVFS